MQSYPYMSNPAKLRKFLQHVQTAKVPPKVTYQYLSSAGYKSRNDRPILPAMKFLGFLDASGVPTKVWQAYRDTQNAPAVLAEAMRTGYSELFSMYEDAYSKDDAPLESFFSSKTNVGKASMRFMVTTFRTLCKLADFGAIPKEFAPEAVVTQPPSALEEGARPEVKITPRLQLNIEIHIAADTPDEKIETIFKNMKKYLLSNE